MTTTSIVSISESPPPPHGSLQLWFRFFDKNLISLCLTLLTIKIKMSIYCTYILVQCAKKMQTNFDPIPGFS